MSKVRIAIAQLNPIVGDLKGNAAKILAAYREAAEGGADLVIAPECVLTGYPLEDLVVRPTFIEAVEDEIHALEGEIARMGFGTSLIYGAPQQSLHDPFPGESPTFVNSAFLIDPEMNARDCYVDKTELPNYGVFDEKRVFISGGRPRPISWRGHLLGLMICEDAWYPRVSEEMLNGGAHILISINGSPFEVGKNVKRLDVVHERISETGLPFIYVNMVGGQDELVFDGGSFIYDGEMKTVPHFKEGVFFFETEISTADRMVEDDKFIGKITDDGRFCGWERKPIPLVSLANYPREDPSDIESIYQACVMGLRDYVNKQGFKNVLLGYSGGVDSGIVAAMACDALGPENVLLVRLPSKFSSDGSLTDAADGAQRLGTEMRTINIEPIVAALRHAYTASFVDTPQADWKPGDSWPRLTGTADENIQARARGNILMAISNQEGRMLLTTGNKSEVSVGYSTLYGDMSGGFNPIKDCYKVTVWELCRWRNALTATEIAEMGFLGLATEVVPEAIIVKPPSAELRPDQKDEDSLPPYPVLDSMLKAMIEDDLGTSETAVKLGINIDTVRRIRGLIDTAEYKRRQAAPGVKITSKLFGRDRRYPIVNRWRG